MAIRDRIARLRAPGNTPRTSSPWWVRATTTAGRPVVLAAALIMSAPAEYHLARTAGFGDPYAYGMPLVLSSYAGIAAVVASTRTKGQRGYASATAGAISALTLAMAAQVIGHWITTGHMDGNSSWLVAIVSSVPPLVVGHLLHLAATPAEDAPQDPRDAAETPAVDQATSAMKTNSTPVLPIGARMLPTATPCGVPPRDQDARPGWGDARDADGEERLVSAAEVAAIVGVDPSTVRNWVSRGILAVARKDARGRNWFDPAALPSQN